ncbi:UDP-glucose 4-epimerase-like [Ostrea edulis]|uniref:UDP-glucose 4-epimerase-like n=1 Tax=Ostrea edulis TaxID=37623 RepID=UPI0024AF9E17|nr:UDP-glucose 4-epimerase-like [Ostrea edulis]XP_048759991.2 UDP-glucose 4-epimerase-like [Ostrea edulis]
MGDNCILVTGGAGFVGSHSVIELIEAGYSVVVMDNLANASMESIKRVEEITGKSIPCHSIDLLDKPALLDLFSKHKFTSVIHFAGLKAVGESCQLPLLYYKNNVGGTVSLLEVMKEKGVKNMIFSSSATVYGSPQYLPIDEKHPVGGCTNPYGKTKYFIEEILRDLHKAEPDWNIIMLRYFNPVGAHKSGKIGEDPQGIPNNLMPFISQVAVGKRAELSVYGSDYDTTDGTGVRDYIHVVDLAQGHVAAQKKIETNCGCRVYNLGTGKGYSVLEMAKAFEEASGKAIPFKKVDRRPGDVASVYGNADLAKQELGWSASLNLKQMCEDTWRWQSLNPNGFRK